MRESAFSIQSYVKVTNEEALRLLLSDDVRSQWFIALDNERAMEKIKNFLDPNYLSGAIIMQYNGEILMDFDLWDEIDMQWPFIIKAVKDFLDNKIGYGDKFRFDWIGYDQMECSIMQYSQEKIYVFSIKEFFMALLSSADYFYRRYKDVFYGCSTNIVISPTVDNKIECIARLKKIVFHTPQSEWWPCVVRMYFHNPDEKKALGSGGGLDNFVYAGDQDYMCVISEALTLDNLIGYLYIEYYGIPILDHTTVFYLDDFFGYLLPVLEQYIMHGVSNVLQYEGLLLVIRDHSDTYISVVINDKSMVVPTKRFLRPILFSTWALFVQKSDIMFRLEKKQGCREEIGLIQALVQRVDELPE